MLTHQQTSLTGLRNLKTNYWARESTYSTYPKDCTLPICALAQNGFFYDNLLKAIRCSECSFQDTDIFSDSLDPLLAKHFKHNMACSQALHSLQHSLALTLHSSKQEAFEPQRTTLPAKPRHKNVYASEENRLKTFENVRLILNTKELAVNGFYRCSNSAISKSNSFESFGNAAGDHQVLFFLLIFTNNKFRSTI